MISEKRKIILREDDSLVSDEQSQNVWRLYLKKKIKWPTRLTSSPTKDLVAGNFANYNIEVG